MVKSISGRKLWRIPEKGMVKGVCAGIAQYLDVPVKLVRLITVLAMVFGLFFFVLVAYIALTFILDPMPAGASQEKPQPTNRDLLDEVDAQLAAGEQRLRSMERYITSDTFRFRQL
jgi:phage shock protein C